MDAMPTKSDDSFDLPAAHNVRGLGRDVCRHGQMKESMTPAVCYMDGADGNTGFGRKT